MTITDITGHTIVCPDALCTETHPNHRDADSFTPTGELTWTHTVSFGEFVSVGWQTEVTAAGERLEPRVHIDYADFYGWTSAKLLELADDIRRAVAYYDEHFGGQR